jgi:predicted Rossmann fold nucleotide-binding protein DprA/Smf involved in DNA uptake
MLRKIISGGQTGADQAGLDAAIDVGFPYGGYIPRSRKTEVGPLSVKYDKMIEIGSSDYRTRTMLNVSASDGTVVFTYGPPEGGSGLTLRLAFGRGKSVFHVDLNKKSPKQWMWEITTWIIEKDIEVLNVAGSRKSKASEIHGVVYTIITDIISKLGAKE